MHLDWQSFLHECGARGDTPETLFADPRSEAGAALTGNILSDLSSYGVLQVVGTDAATFLQGQLTNDVTQLVHGGSQLSGYCSPKGRLLAVVRLIAEDDGFLIRLPAERLQAIRQRLGMFVLRAQVRLTDGCAGYAHAGLAGPDAAEMLATGGVDVPSSVGESRLTGGLHVTCVSGKLPRFEILAPPAVLQDLWRRLEGATPTGPAAWRLLDVLAGLPEVFDRTAELFVPQMLNLHTLGGVSFDKGCYTGQEIVARSQYLGKLKRHLVRARALTGVGVEPGARLLSSGGEIGRVVTTAIDAGGDQRLLAVIQDGALEPPDHPIQIQGGASIEVEQRLRS